MTSKDGLLGFLPLVVAALSVTLGCSDSRVPSADASHRQAAQAPTSLTDLVGTYFKDAAWRLPDADEAEYAFLFDRPHFLRKHRDEMLKTLEVVETVETEKLAVSFVRYSVGTTVYRDSVWMRKFDGRWLISANQYFSEYGDDPFGDGKPDQAKALIKRVDAWEKETANKWW